MLSCLVRCVKMAAKFDEFSISEIMAMLTVMRKFENNTRSRIGHAGPQSMLYSKLRRILVQKVTQYREVCIFLASLCVTLHSLT